MQPTHRSAFVEELTFGLMWPEGQPTPEVASRVMRDEFMDAGDDWEIRRSNN